jgi:hypothetical protein
MCSGSAGVARLPLLTLNQFVRLGLFRLALPHSGLKRLLFIARGPCTIVSSDGEVCMSSNDDFPAYMAMGFVGGLLLFYRGFRTFRKYRVVADTPETPIRSIAMGLARVHGKAMGSDLVSSPVTHSRCLFYKVVVEKYVSHGDSSGWVKFRTDADGVEFHLEDFSGKVLVDARGADYDLLQTARVQAGGFGHTFDGTVGGASESELRQYVTGVTRKKISNFEEHRLNAQRANLEAEQEKARQAASQMFNHAPGSPEFLDHMLAAQGPQLQEHLKTLGPQGDKQKEEVRLALIEAYKHPYHSPEFRESMRHAIALQGGPFASRSAGGGSTSSLYPPASGQYRFTESCILPGHWYDVTGTCTENPNPQDEHDRNKIQKGRNEPTFLISYRVPKEADRMLRRRAAYQIFGGAGMAIACLVYLLFHFDMF